VVVSPGGLWQWSNHHGLKSKKLSYSQLQERNAYLEDKVKRAEATLLKICNRFSDYRKRSKADTENFMEMCAKAGYPFPKPGDKTQLRADG
jgi:hypothetical protein